MAEGSELRLENGLRDHRGRRARVVATLLILSLLLIVARGSLAAVSTDTYERGEELVRGAVAVSLMGGIELPIEDTFYHTYEGGGFVQALLTIPAFTLMGPSFLAHKATAIFGDVLVLLAGCLLARRAFGFRAMVLFGLLHVLAPITFQKLGLLNLGIHYHALFFQYLVAGLSLRLLQEKSGTERAWKWTALALGISGGFGFFYNYQLAPLIGLAGLLLIWRRALSSRAWLHLLGGCVIGLMPLFFMGSRVGTEVFNIHGQFAEEVLEDTEDKKLNPNLQAAIDANNAALEARGERRKPSLSKLPGGVLDAMSLRGFLQFLLFMGLPLVGLSLFKRKPDEQSVSAINEFYRDSNRLLLGFLCIFTALIPLTGFMVVYFPQFFLAMRYAPLWGFATILAAGTIAWLTMQTQATLRHTGLLLAVLTVGLGTWSLSYGLSSGSQPDIATGLDRLANLKGTNFNDYYSKIATRLERGHVATLQVFIGVDGASEADLYAAAAEAVYKHSVQPLDEVIAELKLAAPENWRLFLPGLGAWTLKGRNGSLIASGNKLFRELSKLPDGPEKKQISDQVFFGLGRRGSFFAPTEAHLAASIHELELGRFPPACMRGLGHHCFHHFQLTPANFYPFIADHKPKTKKLITAGFEEALKQRSLGQRAE